MWYAPNAGESLTPIPLSFPRPSLTLYAGGSLFTPKTQTSGLACLVSAAKVRRAFTQEDHSLTRCFSDSMPTAKLNAHGVYCPSLYTSNSHPMNIGVIPLSTNFVNNYCIYSREFWREYVVAGACRCLALCYIGPKFRRRIDHEVAPHACDAV